MLLDIIITHYNEPFETGKKLLDSIQMQRGVSRDDFRVVIVNDGIENKISDYCLNDYTFHIENVAIPHAGVSAARNYGIDNSTARWVMFCDFDDMFASIYALRNIITLLDTEDYDILWSPFYVENFANNSTHDYMVRLQGLNLIWVHSRVYRREMLNRENMRFDERLFYAEDSAFNAILNEIVPHNRVGKIVAEAPLYLWCYRENSATTNPENLLKNALCFITRNESVVEEFIRRGIDERAMVGRMFWDAFCAAHKDGASAEDIAAIEDRFRPLVGKYRATFDKVKKVEMDMVKAAALKGVKGNITGKESMEQWLQRLEGRRIV